MSSIPGYPTPAQDHRLDDMHRPVLDGEDTDDHELTLGAEDLPPGLPPLGQPLLPKARPVDGE